MGKLEDIRISSQAYMQIRIGEFVSVIFTTVGISSAIIASEAKFYVKNENIDMEVESLHYVCFIATILLALSLYQNTQLWMRWKIHKHFYSEGDTMWNTGLYKNFLFELAIILVQPYPWLEGITYTESHNGTSPEFQNFEFEVNEVLLCAMIFLRFYFFSRSVLRTTQFTDPRAQRICGMYGTEATYKFALKSVMK